MYKITKEFHFCASHELLHLPKTHPCYRLHGHNYVIKVELQAKKLGADGFIVDYRKLDCIKQYIDQKLDHRHLNDVLPEGVRPTAETMAKHFYERFKLLVPELSAVEISETPKTNARYEP